MTKLFCITLLGFILMANDSFCQTGKYDSEINGYRQTLASKPNDNAAIRGLGRLYFLSEQYDSASTYIKKVLELTPNDWEYNYYMGTVIAENDYYQTEDSLIKRENGKKALRFLKKSLKASPDFPDADAEIGRVYERMGQYDSAETYDIKAIRLDPNQEIATNNLGCVYMATGRYKKAIQTFKSALTINPEFDLANFNMARTYSQLKEYDSAIHYYSIMLRYHPNYLDALQEMGMAYFRKEQYDSAEVYFNKVLIQNPYDANAINNLGAIYLNTKNYAAAIVEFTKAIRINPNYVNGYSNLGRACYFNKQYDEAINAFVKEGELDKTRTMDIPYIALSYQALGNMTEARRYEAISKQYYSDFKLP